jgi:hypothetical protein
MLWLRAKTIVVSNKRRVLHLLRAASAKTFIILGVCLKQSSTKQAIKTFTEHCACLNNRFYRKTTKIAQRKNPKISYFTNLFIPNQLRLCQGKYGRFRPFLINLSKFVTLLSKSPYRFTPILARIYPLFSNIRLAQVGRLQC